MTYTDVMKELDAMGTAQNRKVYARHGVGENMYGVSFANLGKLAKKIKCDQALAEKLWASGNHDARVLAAMIADPAAMTDAELDAWAHDLDNYVVTDAFGGLAAKSGGVHGRARAWTKSKDEWVGRAGWRLVSVIARSDAEAPDELFEGYLVTIESTIHESKNRVRDAMNSALIAIALRGAALEKKAVAAAKRIGKVEVDHGETGCKTPDAIGYIEKTKAHYAAQRAKKAAGAKKSKRAGARK